MIKATGAVEMSTKSVEMDQNFELVYNVHSYNNDYFNDHLHCYV